MEFVSGTILQALVQNAPVSATALNQKLSKNIHLHPLNAILAKR